MGREYWRKIIWFGEKHKLIADFKEDENKEDEADPTCMKGYKYLVKGEKKANVKLETTDHEVITIDMIWQCKGRLLSSTGVITIDMI
ncbi:hypothetical protein CFP56_007829 [Quercus suber]|uniref:Uncharacterized protein n=1 Tax=Quercus suber TaxID=58331 RepID=A0AAW0M5Y9_QUESU